MDQSTNQNESEIKSANESPIHSLFWATRFSLKSTYSFEVAIRLAHSCIDSFLNSIPFMHAMISSTITFDFSASLSGTFVVLKNPTKRIDRSQDCKMDCVNCEITNCDFQKTQFRKYNVTKFSFLSVGQGFSGRRGRPEFFISKFHFLDGYAWN